jgi:S-(hydroxymethyl)glutathione dehydrogenase/alcohol dehydrogenase
VTFAAIVWNGREAVLHRLELSELGPTDVRVRVRAASICGSDLTVLAGGMPQVAVPCVLGHEVAGVVAEVGPAVTTVQPGDAVVLTTIPYCSSCAACARGEPTECRASYAGTIARGRLPSGPVSAFGNVGGFAEVTTVDQLQCVGVPDDVPPELAALLGCGVLTGTGAVWRRARVWPGSTVLVIGAGAVGLAVIAAARLAGASRIVVADVRDGQEPVARSLGATDFVPSADEADLKEALARRRLPEGVDFAFECTGIPQQVRQAVAALDWGGTCTIVGVPKMGSAFTLRAAELYHNKQILGCRYGAAQPRVDIPRLAELHRQGRLPLTSWVTHRYPFHEFDAAVTQAASGRGGRVSIVVAP